MGRNWIDRDRVGWRILYKLLAFCFTDQWYYLYKNCGRSVEKGTPF